MVLAEEVASCNLPGKLEEVKRVCERSTETVLSRIVKVVEMDCVGVEAK